jgi:hypothetical protein
MYGIVIGSVGLGVICHLAYRYLEPGKSGCGVFLYTADIVYAGGGELRLFARRSQAIVECDCQIELDRHREGRAEESPQTRAMHF